MRAAGYDVIDEQNKPTDHAEKAAVGSRARYVFYDQQSGFLVGKDKALPSLKVKCKNRLSRSTLANRENMVNRSGKRGVKKL